MTTAATPALAGFDLMSQLRRWRDGTRRAYARRAAFQQTYNELNMLSNRELNDIGLVRSQIEEIAREAARMAA